MDRKEIIQELYRLDDIEWMHNVRCNSDITIDLYDLRNERWYCVFCRDKRRGRIAFYGQSAKYPGGDVWKLEDVDTDALKQIVKRLQFIERRGERLPFPKPGNYHDRISLQLNQNYG